MLKYIRIGEMHSFVYTAVLICLWLIETSASKGKLTQALIV